ncbi:hypothetical protein FOMPIDRAFT_1132570 [Fomitopsis schrenkii]|uniref:Uncharacterized protein n=1 Tax=Fomitopsis schrenkii TaxID=2126942 RepID=S8DRT2_FOMSC|nr:hypothetical protein FOMPIDRAFT_1132570 [Fomitopsis schrenkii]
MSTAIDVSGKLGEYMLKGWVLTDKSCPKCSRVPLMRSPSGPTVHFCANCDAAPGTSTASSSRSGPDIPERAAPIRNNPTTLDEKSSVGSTSSATPSRTSTPPTEVSQALSSPTFAPPMDMAEVLRRRQQSDTASAEIGRRMLKGWAMLADECPNPTCYGIPLVRPPKPGGQKDPRKECVVCGAVYIYENDAPGAHLVPLQPSPNTSAGLSTLLPQPPPAPVPVPAWRPISAPRLDLHASTSVARAGEEDRVQRNIVLPPASGSHLAVQESVQSLELALHVLSGRVTVLSNGTTLETALIAQTADAMSKVAQALAQVRQLQ